MCVGSCKWETWLSIMHSLPHTPSWISTSHISPHTHTPPSHHNPQVKNGNTYLTPYLASTVQSVERKLIFIPIIFILLRIWSLLFTIIDIEAPGKLSCPAVEFFLHMGVRVEGCEIWAGVSCESGGVVDVACSLQGWICNIAWEDLHELPCFKHGRL